MPDRRLIETLDEAAAVATPAGETVELDGWQLRRTAGLSTKRANSVWPRAWTGGDIGAAVARVRAFYASADLPARFQLSPAARPDDLEARLTEAGWQRLAPTEVHTGALAAVATGPADGTAVVAEERPGAGWWDTWRRALALDPAKLTPVGEMLDRIAAEMVAVTVSLDGSPAGVGLAIAHGDWVGVFNMATLPAARGRGVGRTAIAAIASWGVRRGSSRMYLQVERGNDPALALYRRAGLAAAYEYVYLVDGG